MRILVFAAGERSFVQEAAAAASCRTLLGLLSRDPQVTVRIASGGHGRPGPSQDCSWVGHGVGRGAGWAGVGPACMLSGCRSAYEGARMPPLLHASLHAPCAPVTPPSPRPIEREAHQPAPASARPLCSCGQPSWRRTAFLPCENCWTTLAIGCDEGG